MSFDVFLQAFKNHDFARGDGEALLAALPPFSSRGEGWAVIETSDGSADLYGIDEPARGLMFNHVSGHEAWEVIFAAARDGGFAVMPVGCGTLLPDEAMRDELPEGIPKPVRVIRSGAELLAIIESS